MVCYPAHKKTVKLVTQIFAVVSGLLACTLFVTLSFLVLKSHSLRPVNADTETLTHRVDWMLGKFDGTQADSKEGDVILIGDGNWGPKVWRSPDAALTTGTSTTSDGNYVYVLAGRDYYFARYLPTENRWEDLTAPYTMSDAGSDMTYLDGYIYTIFGGAQKEFKRYSIAHDLWEDLADTPDLVSSGGTSATDGTTIFALRGGGTTDFWTYDISDDIWSLVTGPAATISTGAELKYDNGYLYTPRGANTTTFYRYSISGQTWSTMTAAPGTFNDDRGAAVKDGYIYYPRGNATADFYRYNITGNSWDTLTSTPIVNRYVGAVYNDADDQIYVFRGNGTNDFWKYDDAGNEFVGPTNASAAFSVGADLVHYSGYLYAPRGANTTTFSRYNIAGNSWESRAAAPASFNDDTKGVAAGSYLYFFRGSNVVTFYRYDPAGDSWSTMADAPATVRYGGALVYPGSGDYIYATRGNYTRTFWRYSISGNSWDDISVADLPDNTEASYGARLAYDGTDIYYISGSRTGQILKYVIGTDTWSSLDSLPYGPFYGTDMTYYDGNLYIQAGYYKKDFWRYNIASGEWTYMDPLSQQTGYDYGPYDGGSLESDGSGQIYSIEGRAQTNMNVFTVGTDDFPVSGTWTSDTIDLTYVSGWNSLASSVTTPGDSAVTLETRTSADLDAWSTWEAVPGGSIASPEERYIQIRATLSASSDQTQAPTLHSLTLDYDGDTTDPTNPDTFDGSSQEVGGVELTDGEAYKYANPYFTWSGASDTESEIEGYYVYFGTSSGADPQTLGNFQTASSYLATEPMSSGNYYLRLQTKDTAGNISSAITGFTYEYSGISATSLTLTDTGDFDAGSLSSVSTAGDELKLESKEGFWKQTRLTLVPANVYHGSSIAYVASSNKLYVFRGGTTNVFYEYDIATDVWTTLTAAPTTLTYGAQIIEGPSGYLYAFAGNNTTTFWRYDISGNSWDDGAATDAPQTINFGSSLIYDGSQYIYALRGNTDDSFFRYDTTGNSWETLANIDFDAPTYQADNLVRYGGDLAYDGNDTIYAMQGTARTGFASYSISGNEWTRLPNLPAFTYDGSKISYDETQNVIYLLAGNSKPFLFKYDIESATWTKLADGPLPFYIGSAMRNINGKLYVIRGNNTRSYYTYDTAKDLWELPTRGMLGGFFQGQGSRAFNSGAEIVKGDGNYFYFTQGNYESRLFRFDPTTGETVELAPAPLGFFIGGTIAYESTNNQIYAAGSQYDNRLMIYDIDTDTWSEETSDPFPLDPGAGTTMVYDGSQYMYWARGGATTSFYRFDTQGSSGTKWAAMTGLPATVADGAQLVYRDGYVYTLRGNNIASNPFYRYTPGSNSWTTLTGMSINVYNDGFLVDAGGDHLYACRATNTASCYKYEIAGGTWSSITNAPAQIFTGGSAASDGSGIVHVIAGPGTDTYSDGLYTYVAQTDSTSFEASGSYTSEAIDLGSIYRFGNLEITYTSATNADIEITTRSSANGSDWTAWSAVSQEKQIGSTYKYKINSTVNQYIQVKFDFSSSDSVYSGIVSDYTINYYQDTDAPTNPSSLSAYDSGAQAVPLTTDTWYTYGTPNFDWPDAEAVGGASDTATGSGVAGYYVYLGTNSSADPSTSGTFVTDSEYDGSGLVSGSTYYLRIETIDEAGNTSAAIWAPFIYKYDATGPTVPGSVSADPAGYSSTDSFDFTWTASTDAGSGVDEYCYKTGAGSGLWASDQCSADLFVTGVPSYQSAQNIFYVRAKDTAGNYSSYATTSYYFSSDAPSPPQNLEVTPNTNTENSFAFEWDAPATYFGSTENLRYYYSVNSHPTMVSVTETANTFLSAGPFATLPGENIFYIVAKDEAGNIDYDLYESITFTANTSAPGIPISMDIADVSVKATSSWKIAISWEEPEDVGAGVDTYKIFRSEDNSSFEEIASSRGISYVDTGLEQLTYYYKVKACDNTNNCGSFSTTVSMYPDGKFVEAAPLVGEPLVTDITTKTATISWATSRTSDSKVAFGESSGDYNTEEVGSSEQVTGHELLLTNLSAGTTYYFVAKWTDEDGNTGISDEYSFTTLPAPTIKDVVMSSIGITSAQIKFTITGGSKARVYYGESTAFGGVTEISTSTSEATYIVTLDGLLDGTKYFYKINGFDSDDEEYEGTILDFTTLPSPRISDVQIQQVKGTAQSTVLVLWNTNTEVSSIVTYYPVDNPGATRDEVNVKLEVGEHKVLLRGLLPQTTYNLIVSGRDIAGNEARSEVQTLTTSTDTRPAAVLNLKVEGTIIKASAEAESLAQLVVTWDTDEPTTAQVEYGEGTGTTYSQKTQEDTNLTTNHMVIISGLTPSKVYHLRALSTDSAGNRTESIDTVTITPKVTENALDLVIANLQEAFGFIGSIN